MSYIIKNVVLNKLFSASVFNNSIHSTNPLQCSFEKQCSSATLMFIGLTNYSSHNLEYYMCIGVDEMTVICSPRKMINSAIETQTISVGMNK